MRILNLQWLNPVWLCENAFTLYGKGGDAPAAPDYTAAAKATAAGNLDAAKIAAAANRVNQVTPNGSLTYTQNPSGSTFNQSGFDAANAQYQQQLNAYNQNSGIKSNPQKTGTILDYANNANNGNYSNNAGSAPVMPNSNSFYSTSGPDTYTATTSLSPAEQSKLDKNNQLSNSFLDTANNGIGQVQNALAKGFDFNALPAQQINAGQTAQDAIMSRLSPELDRQNEALRTQLANQGVIQGSQAYNTAMDSFGRQRNDANTQAALQGMGIGQQARQQALQEQEFGRTEPINIINALRTGNQVQNPNFVNTPQQATTQGPDLLGAAQSNYNAQLGNYNAQQAQGNNMMSGLFGLGAAAMTGGVGTALGAKIGSYFGSK